MANWGKWPDGGNGKIGPLMAQWNMGGGGFDDIMGKLETLAMGKMGPLEDLMGTLLGPKF